MNFVLAWRRADLPQKGSTVGVDQATVRKLVADFLESVDKSSDNLADDVNLWGDGLGLDSLEAAELSANLEDAFGSDPFSTGDQMPETVGDVVAFYEVTAAT